MAPRLSFERHYESAVGGNIDHIDRVHLDGDF
jgi:hypothetical protein